MLPRSSVVWVGKIGRLSLVDEVRRRFGKTWQDNARPAGVERYYANMNCVHYPAERLVELFRRQTVATFPELAAALETSADRTVFRRLAELDYRTSYSHRGAYYTLDSLARYDAYGLWSHEDVHFSKHGTLLDTAGGAGRWGQPAGCWWYPRGQASLNPNFGSIKVWCQPIGLTR